MVEKNITGRAQEIAANSRIYKDLPWQYSKGRPVIDFLYEKPFYGKIDRKVNAIQLKESNLKQVPSERATIFAVNFVADAFEAMQKYYKKALVGSSINSTGRLVSLQPLRGWSSLTNHYKDHMDSLYREFILEYIPEHALESQITSFDKFMSIFMEFVEDITPDVPITKTAFLCSRYCPVHVSGLVIELDVEGMKHGNFSQNASLLDDPNFEFYRTTAKKYGFYVSKNAPWCLVANINSRGMGTATNSITGESTSYLNGMARYMETYHINRDNIFDSLYFKTHLGFEYDDYSSGDIHLLRYYLLQFYNGYIGNDPFHTKNVACNTWKKVGAQHFGKYSSKSKIIYREPVGYIDENGHMPATYLTNYNFFYWLEKYINIRMAEQDLKGLNQKMFMVAKKVKHSCGTTRAINYVNESIKGFQKTQYAISGKYWQGSFENPLEKVNRDIALIDEKFAMACTETTDSWLAKMTAMNEQIASQLASQGYIAPEPMYKNKQHHLHHSMQTDPVCASPCQCPQGTVWNAAMGVCLSITQDPGSNKSFLDPCEQDPTAEGCLPPPEEDHEDPREDWMKVYADCVQECVASGKRYQFCRSQCEEHKPWQHRSGDAGKCPDGYTYQQTGQNSGKCVPPPPPVAEAEPGVPTYTIEELERGCEEGWITDPSLCAQIEEPPPSTGLICDPMCDKPGWAQYHPERCTGCPPPPPRLHCGPGFYYDEQRHRCLPVSQPPGQNNCPDGWAPVMQAFGKTICLPPGHKQNTTKKEDLQISDHPQQQECPPDHYKDASGICQPIVQNPDCPPGHIWNPNRGICEMTSAHAAYLAQLEAQAAAADQAAWAQSLADKANAGLAAAMKAKQEAAAAQAEAEQQEEQEEQGYFNPCDNVTYKMSHPEECGSPGAMGGNPVAGVPGASASTGTGAQGAAGALSPNLAELKEICGELVWSDERGEYTCSETGEAAPAELVEAETDGVVEPEDGDCPYPGQIKDFTTGECKCPPGHKLNNLTLKCEKDDNDDDVITMINF